MNKSRFLTLIFVLALVLSGCASIYQPPKATEPTAVIQVKNERSGLATWITLEVEEIDNKSAGLQLMPGNLRIYPGSHILTVKALFNKGFFSSGPFEAFTDVSADFKSGETYFIQAEVKGSKLLVWISDRSGKKISAVSATSYRSAPRAQLF